MKKIILALALIFGLGKAHATIRAGAIDSPMMGAYVMAGGINSSTSDLNVELQHIVALGYGTVRWNSDFWTTIEPSSGVFSWTKLDIIVNMITNTYGLKMITMLPISASWTPIQDVCPATNPYTGALIGCTHFPTSNIGLYNRMVRNLTGRYSSNGKMIWEIWNEPDNPAYWKAALFPDTTGYVLIATNAYVSIRSTDTTQPILFGALAFPLGKTLPGSTTHYIGRLYFSDAESKLLGNATNFPNISMHIYENAEGGGVTTEACLSSCAAVLANYGVTISSFYVTETAAAGGCCSVTHAEESSWGMRAFTDNLTTGTVSVIYHTLDYDGLAMYSTVTWSPYDVASMMEIFGPAILGYTPQGDLAGGTVHIYNFTSGASNIYVAWTDIGTYSWNLDPTTDVILTDILGVTTTHHPVDFSPYTLTTDPIFLQVPQGSLTVKGQTIKGLRFNQ